MRRIHLCKHCITGNISEGLPDGYNGQKKNLENGQREFVGVCQCTYFKKFGQISEIREESIQKVKDNVEMCPCMGGHMAPIISVVFYDYEIVF